MTFDKHIPALATAFLLAACATPPAVDWPAALAPSPQEALLTTVSARGVQIYECRAGGAGAAWAFVAPEATLSDDAGRTVGRHGAGPFWEAEDGSRVQGSAVASADAPDADAIAWLLLRTRSTGPAGRFSDVTGIRRIHTAGGKAPRSGCSAESAGATARVPYSADYLFYTTR